MNICILGTGAFGMALASIFYNNKWKIKMWTNSKEEADFLNKTRKSNKIDYDIPSDIIITTDMKEASDLASIIVLAVPAEFTSNVTKELKKYYNKKQVICIASKGIEQNTGMFLYDIVRNNLKVNNIAIISGRKESSHRS